MTEEHQHKALVTALCEILGQCNVQKYYVLHLNENLNSTTLVNGDSRVNIINDSEINFEGTTSTIAGIKTATATIVDPVSFHDNIRITLVQSLAEVEKYYLENINVLKAQYGILLFLYSVIITKVTTRTKVALQYVNV